MKRDLSPMDELRWADECVRRHGKDEKRQCRCDDPVTQLYNDPNDYTSAQGADGDLAALDLVPDDGALLDSTGLQDLDVVPDDPIDDSGVFDF